MDFRDATKHATTRYILISINSPLSSRYYWYISNLIQKLPSQRETIIDHFESTLLCILVGSALADSSDSLDDLFTTQPCLNFTNSATNSHFTLTKTKLLQITYLQQRTNTTTSQAHHQQQQLNWKLSSTCHRTLWGLIHSLLPSHQIPRSLLWHKSQL